MARRDLVPAEKVRLINQLTHTKGPHAGEPFNLRPWQERIVRALFRTNPATGRRQYRTMLLMLPALIAETGLLSFISRHHLEGSQRRARLREVPVKATTMRRQLVVTYREGGYLGPSAQRLIALLEASRESS